MLRPLLLLAALGSATAQCTGSVSVRATTCNEDVSGFVPNPPDLSALIPPQWSCAGHKELVVGDIVPYTVKLKNVAQRNFVDAPVEIQAGAVLTVYFACSTPSCGGVGGPDAYTNVIVTDSAWTEGYTAALAGTTFASPRAGVGQITFSTAVLIPGNGEVEVGTIYTKAATRAPNLPDKPPGLFYLYGNDDGTPDALDAFALLADAAAASGDTCAAAAFGGSNSEFLNSPPPSPPPPPPDCCTDFSRGCLARCEQCKGPKAVDRDAEGEPCIGHCTFTCGAYPSDQSVECFSRCTGCSQGAELTPDGLACRAAGDFPGACDDCLAYDKCMKAGDCVVGCQDGRRERKLLFAPIPICAPCCKKLA